MIFGGSWAFENARLVLGLATKALAEVPLGLFELATLAGINAQGQQLFQLRRQKNTSADHSLATSLRKARNEQLGFRGYIERLR